MTMTCVTKLTWCISIFLLGLCVLIATCQAQGSTAAEEDTTYTGYLVDRFCWELPNHIALDGSDLLNKPQDHTWHCMSSIPACRENGYLLMEKYTNGTFGIKYAFDAVGNSNVLEFLDSNSDLINDIVVTATGVDNNNGTLVEATLREATPEEKMTFLGEGDVSPQQE